MNFTPKKASWLNMVEMELSALSKQCLDRRIGNIGMLRKETIIWAKDRSDRGVRINWEFTKEAARTKLDRHYRSARDL
jgi:hypothetical protein